MPPHALSTPVSAADEALRLVPCGPRAVLIEVRSQAAALSLAAFIAERRAEPPLAGVVEVVPGARTVLLDGDGTWAPDVDRLATLLARWQPKSGPPPPSRQVDIPVVYDGPDLAIVATAVGLTPRQTIELHTAATLSVAFCGFQPGFGYLTGLPERLRLPRRPSPRPHVPAGSVALAAGFTAVYTQDGPGGWHLIGHTDLALWDLHRDPPALLSPGTAVRFQEQR